MKRRLELTWVGKEDRPRLEPRLLVEEDRWGDPAAEPNLLIQGDNLLALKALEADYAGKVKCVFIDPPYNTGSAFEHYDDGLEHSIWLSMMRDRLEVIRTLLSEDGSLWVTLDDNEAHYFKVMADEVFGRGNYVGSAIWQKRYSRENRGVIGDAHDYVIIYCNSMEAFKYASNKISIDDKSAAVYKNPNNDPKGRWRGIPMTAQGFRPNQMYRITTPSGAVHEPPEGRCWSTTEDKYLEMVKAGRVYFGKGGDAQPAVIRYLSEVDGITPWTWWPHDECGHNDESKKEMHALFGRENAFPTPKPERLLKRILEIATNPGDLVLDSFAGSGTTGAVAQKMGRRWIMAEIGDHARTHIIPRLRKVVAGEDPGGVTAATGWQGGGAFRFCRLAPSLIARDRWGRDVISPDYGDGNLLAQALCKLEGYRFEPSETEWWLHGRSSETDFLHVTTQTLTHAQLAELGELVGEGRTLLVLCGAWRGDASPFANLTVRKIPDHVLKRCDWGRDSYALPEPIEAAE